MFDQRAHLPPRAPRALYSFALLLAFSSLTLFAQTSPSAPVKGQAPPSVAGSAQPQPSAPTISTAADEVSLDLVVRTKRGKPILDVKPSDLAVTDNGAPVTLSDLHLVTGVSQSQRLISLVFDRLDPGAAKNAREIADKILKAIPDKGYSYAVLQMNGRLRILQSWTEQHDAVEQAIAAATARDQTASAGFTPAEKQILAAAQDESLSADFADRARAKILLSALEESQRILEDQHAYPALSALLALTRAQRQITGRKLILYFAQGLNADSDARDTIRSLVGQANRAGVTICAIDTAVLNQQMGDQMMGAMAMASQGPGAAISSANALGATGYGRGQSGPPIGQVMDAAQNMASFEFNSMDEYQSPLTKLADGTGGVYIRAGASLKRPLRELHDELTTYYEAAYVPNIKDYNGAFRPIVIRPLRKDMVVSSRSGYFAIPPENGSGIRPFEVPLLNILSGEHLPSDLAFRASILHLGQLPDGNSGELTVAVPVTSLQIHDDGNTHMSSVHVTIVALIKNDKGAVVQRFSQDTPLHEAPDLLHKGDDNIVTMQRHFTADPGTYTLETAVLDRFSNKAGAQRTTFTIAPVPRGPALSDLALVRKVQPLHAETASFEPMRYLNGRILPDLTDELPEDTRGFSVFFIVHPVPGASQPQLSMQIARNGDVLAKMPLALQKPSGLGNAIPYLGTVQGHAFPPGNYTVIAVLNQDGQTATSSTSFKVEGTIAASMAPSSSFFSVAGSSGTDKAADQSFAAAAATSNSQFAISSPANPLPPPSDSEIHDMVEGARQRALAWSETLPNFLCLEITDHSIDPGGRGDWRHKNTMVELMRYLDHQESRTIIEMDGQRARVEPADLDFAHSIGEFGGMFKVVFDPSAKATFAWKEADILDGQPVQVFTFKVARANSNFSLTGLNNRQLPVGFHGQFFLDPATRSIRRLTVDADDIPENLSVRATSISVDYGWIAINNHDYLLPVRGAVSLREGKHQAVLNEFEFRNYRRFGSQVRILTKDESKNLPKD